MATDTTGIATFLDSVRAGWGQQYAAAFAEVGIDRLADFADIVDDIEVELKSELSKAGAKTLHVKKILAAVAASTAACAAADEVGQPNGKPLYPLATTTRTATVG